ncbi:hypothetical protein WBJ53_27405 [Spirosoma sp. SC4-14]|uniref:hypothetical protein n=1 Tax=Spirosoma sp. SC4-14 TaxID=3128900 RepID=UPI0030D33105
MDFLSYSLITIALVAIVMCERRIKRYQTEQQKFYEQHQLEIDQLNENIDQLYQLLKTKYPTE